MGPPPAVSPPPNPADLTVVRTVRDRLTGDRGAEHTHVLRRCTWASTSSTEQSARSETGQQVVTRRDIYCPDPAADVVSTDRVRFPGEAGAPRWHVVGDVDQWVSPWGTGQGGAKFVVERTAG